MKQQKVLRDYSPLLGVGVDEVVAVGFCVETAEPAPPTGCRVGTRAGPKLNGSDKLVKESP